MWQEKNQVTVRVHRVWVVSIFLFIGCFFVPSLLVSAFADSELERRVGKECLDLVQKEGADFQRCLDDRMPKLKGGEGARKPKISGGRRPIEITNSSRPGGASSANVADRVIDGVEQFVVKDLSQVERDLYPENIRINEGGDRDSPIDKNGCIKPSHRWSGSFFIIGFVNSCDSAVRVDACIAEAGHPKSCKEGDPNPFTTAVVVGSHGAQTIPLLKDRDVRKVGTGQSLTIRYFACDPASRAKSVFGALGCVSFFAK